MDHPLSEKEMICHIKLDLEWLFDDGHLIFAQVIV